MEDISLSLSIFSEKISGKGEDAPPICEEVAGGSFLLGVFDGMGGAGSKKYTKDGKTYSGAYFASRITQKVVKSFFQQGGAVAGTSTLSAKLGNEISVVLKNWLVSAKYEQSRIKSSLISTLPTTLAIINYCSVPLFQFPIRPGDSCGYNALNPCEDSMQNPVEFICIWAGDSRGYILNPSRGLMQITKDDIHTDCDALISLRTDPPMSNYVNVDTKFRLNLRHHHTDSAEIVFTATDGCFGYLPSPMHFEWLLLSTLQNADSMKKWEDLLKDELVSNVKPADDFSLAMLGIKFKDFETLKAAFEERTRQVSEIMKEYDKRLEKAKEEIEEKYDERDERLEKVKEEAEEEYDKRLEKAKEEIVDALWQNYKENYNFFLNSFLKRMEEKHGNKHN